MNYRTALVISTLLSCSCLLLTTARAGTVITTNLPPDTQIVNIDARADVTGSYSSDNDQSFWYRPSASAPSLKLPAGSYQFRIIDPADAASLYPDLTSDQLKQLYTAWTYNSPWTEDYLVFKNSALSDSSEHQLFDAAIAPGTPNNNTFASAQAAYDGTKANGYYNQIRLAPPGRSGDASSYRTGYTFNDETTVLFTIPDYDGDDNQGGVSVVVTRASPPPPAPPTLVNISTRLSVEAGDNVLIGGFIVSGAQPKKIIVRAIGPSLPVTDRLANPTLELYSGSTLIDSNDDWVDSPNKQEISDSQLAPSDNLESAILTTLPANGTAYTAIVRGTSGGTGTGLVEVYDLDRTVDSKLANVSTRGFVETGDDVMIGGVIVDGGSPLKVLFRALGPSLASAGINNALQDPTLELHDSNGAIVVTNDNWQTDPGAAEIETDGFAPTDPRESATLQTLSPGAYTAIVRGQANGTGVGLVEAYNVQ